MPLADPLLVAIAAGLLALVMARGLWHKLSDHAMFRATLADYGLVPERLVPAVAVGLAAAEALVALGLVVPMTRMVAALAGAVLLALYAWAIAVNIRRGHVTIDCGCGGPGHGLSWMLVARNLGLIGVALVAALAPAGRALGLADAAMLVGAVLTGWLLLAVVEQAASNGAYVWLHRNGRR
ncbi:MAG: MauE/DoxX family redox-associated membrane protein [Parvibaculaceae bacterium]